MTSIVARLLILIREFIKNNLFIMCSMKVETTDNIFSTVFK